MVLVLVKHSHYLFSLQEFPIIMLPILLIKHHLETYKNLYKIRNILYERYKTLLNEKVLKQRIQIKAFDLKHQQQLKHKEQKVCVQWWGNDQIKKGTRKFTF